MAIRPPIFPASSSLALVVLQPIVKLCPTNIVVCDALTVGFGVVATGLTVV
jgi:hypothetical protein